MKDLIYLILTATVLGFVGAFLFVLMMLHYKTFWAVAFILIFGALAYGEVKRWLKTQ